MEKENSAVLVFIPVNANIEAKQNKLYADDVVIDYHYVTSK